MRKNSILVPPFRIGKAARGTGRSDPDEIFLCPPFPHRKGGEGDRTPLPFDNGATGIGPHYLDETSLCPPFPLRKGGEGDRTAPSSAASGSPSHDGKGLGVRLSASSAISAVVQCSRHLCHPDDGSVSDRRNGPPDSFAFLCHPDDSSNARGGTGLGQLRVTRSRFRSPNSRAARAHLENLT
jgi:hypothetical protein